MMSKHPSPPEGGAPPTGRHYWRSLDELARDPAVAGFLRAEFPEGAEEASGVDRRRFMKVMAASFGLAGAGSVACRRPEQRILPYAQQPERLVPGVPVHYATSHPSGKDNIPLVVETHSARPTKAEGNAKYAPYGGATDLFAQAGVLDLYDPDRSTRSSNGARPASPGQVHELLGKVAESAKANAGAGLAFLAEKSTSPTRARLVGELLKAFPRATWAEYDPADSDAAEAATEGLFAGVIGRLRPLYDFRKAKRVLSLDADFLHGEPGHLRYARDYAASRREVDNAEGELFPEKMSRLYQVESTFSVTGGMADHRFRLGSCQVPAFAALVVAEVLEKKRLNPGLASRLRQEAGNLPGHDRIRRKDGRESSRTLFSAQDWVSACVDDLLENAGRAVVVAGCRQPVEVHQLAYFLNDLLGASGKTVSYLELPRSPAVGIAQLAEKIRSDAVETLVILGGNPAYDAPADLGWGTLQKKVKGKAAKGPGAGVIRLGYHHDETSLDANWHLAATHYLESWGDGRTFDGTVVPVQPMILPIFEGISELEVIGRLAGAEDPDPYTQVAKTFGGGTGAFDRFLNEGVHPGSAFRVSTARLNSSRIESRMGRWNLDAPKLKEGNLEVVIAPSPSVGDGRYANNGWCQEVPDVMTKICWDNAICVSPRLGKTLGIRAKQKKLVQKSARKANTHDMGREVSPVYTLTLPGRGKVTGPVHIQPGLANHSVIVHLGYGRTKVGRVGRNAGFSAYPLTSSKGGFIASGATLKPDPDERSELLANTQEHWSMEGRALYREANLDGYTTSVAKYAKDHHGKRGSFVDTIGMESHSPSPYGESDGRTLQEKVSGQYRGNSAYEVPVFADRNADGTVSDREKAASQQWGMSIDLNTCIACNACVVACQAENNIPVVGKDQVTRGREMHWIRLDRYYHSGSKEANLEDIPEDPQVSIQPVACVHCEMAPCESVCPVNATVHDDQGINTMAYNRCVGTRYCSNNCPYKVRRFNFFDYNKRDTKEYYKGPAGDLGSVHAKKGFGAMQKNPDVTVRMRGVMEKCTYCTQRIERAKINQKVLARDSDDIRVADGVIKVACEQACPTGSIVFGDVADPASRVSRLKENLRDYAVLGYLNVRPRTTYLARLRNPNPKMPDYTSDDPDQVTIDKPLSRKEYEEGKTPH